MEKFGRIDVLVNNAAFQIHSSDFEDLTEEHFDTTLKTNLYGYFHMAQEAVPHMKPGSAIINTGSVTGIDGSKELVDYSTTKGGIHAFTRALSGSLVAKGIRVNCVAPGPVWTPLNPSEKEAEQVAQFGVRVEGQRILAFGSRQRDGRHALVDLPFEVARPVARQRADIAGAQRRVDAVVGRVRVHLRFSSGD